MEDRVYPSSKTTTNGGIPTFPPNKAQLYNPTRNAYRPQPHPLHRARSGRRCCCCCFFWTTLVIILVLLLVAIAGAIFWVLFRPHHPSFSVTSLKMSLFNLTSSPSQLNTNFNLTVSARNLNKKITFFYDPISVSLNSDDVDIGDGTFPAFAHTSKNTTLLRSTITKGGQILDDTTVSTLRSNMKKKKGLPLKIQLDTKVKVKAGALKTKKLGIRVTCDGIRVAVPTGKISTTVETSDATCKVDVRVNIWKWTI